MKDNSNKTPNNISNFHSSEERLGNHNPAAPCSKPQRIVLSHKQFISHIGTMVDITSLKGKTINQQGKLTPIVEWLLNDACKRSNGGCVSFGVNQNLLRKDKNNPSGLFPSKILSRALKNLEHYQVFVKAMDSNRTKNANMFKMGDIVMELLDPIIVDTKFMNKARKETIERFRSLGLDPNERKTCPCCRELKFITKFEPYEHNNASIQMVKPVCKECEYKNRQVIISQKSKGLPIVPIEGHKAAWNCFLLERDQLGNLSLSEREVFNQQKRIENKMIDGLLAEA